VSYADSLVADGERIVRRARQHWFVLIWNARWAILSLVTAIALIIMRAAIPQNSGVLTFLSWVTLVLFVVGMVAIGWGWLRYRGREYLLTTRRVVHAEGVVNKRVIDSSLEKINDAVLTESLFGRLLGFGDLEVLTASETGIERLHMLADARNFKRSMIEAKHELEMDLARPTMPALRVPMAALSSTSGTGPPPPPPPLVAGPGGERDGPPAHQPIAPAHEAGPSASPRLTADEVADELDRLAELRALGTITADEFTAHRRDLLRRL